MTLRDLVLFLVGDRGAIDRLAGSRHTLWVGALLVLTASLARNHDGAWLLGEPWVLLHGIVISAVNATIVFSLFFVVAAMKGLQRPRFAPGLLSFVGLFWLTAPMGWAYAIPYEHHLSPVGAVVANAWTLGVVSLWRVALITRVFAVLWGAGYFRCLFIVLLFADVVLLAALFSAPAPVIDFMGGMQHAPEEQALASLNFFVGFWGVVLSPFILAGAIAASVRFRGAWRAATSPGRVSMGVVVMLLAALGAFGALLAVFQPAQQRRFEASRLLRQDPAAGMAYMSRFERSAFPPVWDPPPRLAYGERTPEIPAIQNALVAGAATSPWVRTLYMEKCWRALGAMGYLGEAITHASQSTEPLRLDPAERGRAPAHLLDLIRFHAEHNERLSPALREDLLRWLDTPRQPPGDGPG